MSLARFRQLHWGAIVTQIALSWIIGTTASILLYLGLEGRLFEFDPRMVFYAMLWLWILVLPPLLVVGLPAAILSAWMNKRIISFALIVGILGASAWAIYTAKSAGPYLDATYRMLGSTGIVWAIWELARVLRSEGAPADK